MAQPRIHVMYIFIVPLAIIFVMQRHCTACFGLINNVSIKFISYLRFSIKDTISKKQVHNQQAMIAITHIKLLTKKQ